MVIRQYCTSDLTEIAALFYATVHTVNAKDYSKAQLDVWATGEIDRVRWGRTLLEHNALVAIEDDTIIGFGDIDPTGYLDRLYVHKDYQGQGVATALCSQLEQTVAHRTITTHASVTARSFFVQRGYHIVREQQVALQGVFLTNYVMEKYR